VIDAIGMNVRFKIQPHMRL